MNKNRFYNVNNYLHRLDGIICETENKMTSQKITNSITINFITCILPYHKAAIYMCENLFKHTRNQTFRQIANNIIQIHTKYIEQIEQILNSSSNYVNSYQNVNYYIKEYSETMKKTIIAIKKSNEYKNVNVNFINTAIFHCEGLIETYSNLLKYSIDPRLKNLAQNIITEQNQTIIRLKQIQKSYTKINKSIK